MLARPAAKKAATEELRVKGVRVTLVPHREIVAQGKAHLETHPERYEQTLQRAWQIGVIEHKPPCDRDR